jgi:hypothetical protein
VPEGKVGVSAQRACPVNGCPVDTNVGGTIDCLCSDPSVDCADPGSSCKYYTCLSCACKLHTLPTLTWYLDNDADGYGDPTKSTSACGQPSGYVSNNTDCNDSNKAINPMAVEVCNGVDDNCNGSVDDGLAMQTYYRDLDLDGYGATASGSASFCSAAVAAGAGYVASNTDCDDTQKTVHPGATEICNGIDDDCSGMADDGLAMQTYYRDLDGDGYGSAASGTKAACSLAVAGPGWVSDNTDCNDGDKNINPGAPEICNNGKDDNCNGVIDTDATNSTFYRDVDGDGYGAAAGGTMVACTPPPGYASSNTDCDDTNPAIHPGAAEVCNGIDDNCDGTADNGLTMSTYYLDRDGDGYGSAASGAKVACGAALAGVGYVAMGGDCDDNDKNVHPGATEICNGKDDDCNGTPDNGLPTSTFYRDADGDGYGNHNAPKTACSLTVAGSGYVGNDLDCDDTDPDVNPAAPERCDNMKDDNCNGIVDTDALPTNVFYHDNDGDGYGAGPGETLDACMPPLGYVTGHTDCNDSDPTVHPGAIEICNGKDDNCVGGIDEDGVCPPDAGVPGDGGPSTADASDDVSAGGGGMGGHGGADAAAPTGGGGGGGGRDGSVGASGSGGDQTDDAGDAISFKRDIACACRMGRSSSTGLASAFGGLIAALALGSRRRRARRPSERADG